MALLLKKAGVCLPAIRDSCVTDAERDGS